MVLALTRERLERPPAAKRRYVPAARLRYEAKTPTLSFRTSAAVRDLVKEWKEKANLNISDIVKIGLERLALMELVDVLKIRISQGGKH